MGLFNRGNGQLIDGGSGCRISIRGNLWDGLQDIVGSRRRSSSSSRRTSRGDCGVEMTLFRG